MTVVVYVRYFIDKHGCDVVSILSRLEENIYSCIMHGVRSG